MIFEKGVSDKIYLKDPVNNYSCTYGKLFAGAETLEMHIRGSVVKKGEAGLLLIKEPFNTMPALLGCWMAGVIPAVFSPHADESIYQDLVKEFDFRFIITDFDSGNNFSGVPSIRFTHNQDVLPVSPATGDRELDIATDKIALLLFSSGTSGKQKCIPLSFDNITNNIASFGERMGFETSSLFLCGSPLWHAHGLYNSFITAFFLRASVIYSGPFSLLNVNKLFTEIEDKSKIIFHITPSMIPILLMYAKKNTAKALPAFDKVICGTSFLDSAKKTEFDTVYGIRMFQQYGMTETLFMTVNDDFPAEKPASVGKLLKQVYIEISDDTGALSNGGIGAIRVKTNACFGSYYGKNGDNTSFKDGYFYTGDIGYFDQDMSLFITGREKDLIKKGGFSISANTITTLLKDIKGIEDAYTIGVNDPQSGEEIYSFYIADTMMAENDIKSELKKHLASNLIPKRIFRVDHFPQTDTGKIIKAEVQALLKELLK